MARARFRGISEHSLDDKGRLSLPSRFKEELRHYESDTLMITLWGEKHLRIYPLAEWEELEDKLRSSRDENVDVSELLRYLIGTVTECPLDKQGRLLLPQGLRSLVNMQKDIVLIGMTDWIEIWNRETWSIGHQLTHKNFDQNKQFLAKLGVF